MNWRCSLVVFSALVGIALTAQRAEAQTTTYSYDALGRLTGATHPGGATVAYTYDAAGNRTQVTTGGATPPPPPAPLSASVSATSYTRSASSVPAAITCQGHGGSGTYSYYWQRLSGDTLTETTTDGYTAATGWVRPVASTTYRASTWRCRVTDTAAAVAYSPNVAVSVKTN